MSDIPSEPLFGEDLPAAHPNAKTLALLLQRRSTTAADLGDPGPSPLERDAILRAATRVPDHGKLAPWRFVTFEGAQREHFGHRLAEIYAKDKPQANETEIGFERTRFLRAPLIIAAIAKITPDHKIPEWEQTLSVGASCFNMLLCASALGYAGQWLTEWYAYHDEVRAALELAQQERIAGFIYIGTAKKAPMERVRPDRSALVSAFGPVAEAAEHPPTDHPRPR